MIVVPIGASGQRLVFTSAVIEHFEKYQQLRWWQREAGGQLFARLALPEILIEEATGPRPTDWRTRNTYRPNRTAEQLEIANRFSRDLHFIGDWHTHPERVPAPSRTDIASMREMVRKSAHHFNGFVLAIVGTDPLPRSLYVSVVSGSDMFPLSATKPIQ
ncbi:MAG: Mov34/MPN/PAD-1 family protein [Nitratireductor rhodophyticola]|uniref:Mov34/MPN/PAD-1 family protein n=1 Tax=Nitratireductor rhodophyticola TaxID=2854036 RepID=UPI0032D9341E